MLAELISIIEKLRTEVLVRLSDVSLRSETEVLSRLVDQLSAQALRRVGEVDPGGLARSTRIIPPARRRALVVRDRGLSLPRV